ENPDLGHPPTNRWNLQARLIPHRPDDWMNIFRDGDARGYGGGSVPFGVGSKFDDEPWMAVRFGGLDHGGVVTLEGQIVNEGLGAGLGGEGTDANPQWKGI